MARALSPTTCLLRQEARMERLLTQEARIIRVKVGANAGIGWRLDRYLGQLLPNMGRSLFARWCRAGWVRVDERQAKAADPVRPGQFIDISAPLPELPDDDRFVTSPLVVLHEGDGYVVVNKPPGQLAHQAGRVLSGTLLNQLMDWLDDRGIDPQEARLVNRIDKDTSGIVLCAWDGTVAGALGSSLQEHGLEKIYLAMAEGCPDEEHGHWRAPIADREGSRIQRMVRADGQPCHTEWWLQEHDPARRYCLLRILLHSGRQHQIRVHAAHAGLPLIGDWLYGKPCHEIPGQCLHAHRLSFDDPTSGERIVVEAPLTEELSAVWHKVMQGGSISHREFNEVERSKLRLEDVHQELLPDGWRKPSWMSSDAWQDLREESES